MNKSILEVRDLKDMLNKTRELYGDRPGYKIKLGEGKYKTSFSTLPNTPDTAPDEELILILIFSNKSLYVISLSSSIKGDSSFVCKFIDTTTLLL